MSFSIFGKLIVEDCCLQFQDIFSDVQDVKRARLVRSGLE